MKVSDIAYISRGIGESPIARGEFFRDLDGGLMDDACDANRIIIVSGYFGEKYILKLLAHPPRYRREKCKLIIILGCDSSSEMIYGKISEEKIKELVIKMGYRKRKISIKIFRDSVPLHTKLYGFLKITSPVWYVGSANASDAIGKGCRHELMVRITGKSAALESYVETLRTHKIASVRAADAVTISAQEFLSNGYLIFKPTRHRRFTYEPFLINSAERRKISSRLGGDSGVPHSDPIAEGFGFDLLSALGTDSKGSEERSSKLSFRRFCIETIYGYWSAAEHIEKIEGMLEQVQRMEVVTLNRIARCLAAKSDDDLLNSFDNYLKASKKFFEEISVKAIPKGEAFDSFRSFLVLRRAWLGDPKWIERNSKKIIIERMPDIWSDESTSQRFLESFVDDVVAVLNSPGKIPYAYRSLRKKLKIDGAVTGESLRCRFGTIMGVGNSNLL